MTSVVGEAHWIAEFEAGRERAFTPTGASAGHCVSATSHLSSVPGLLYSFIYLFISLAAIMRGTQTTVSNNLFIFTIALALTTLPTIPTNRDTNSLMLTYNKYLTRGHLE